MSAQVLSWVLTVSLNRQCSAPISVPFLHGHVSLQYHSSCVTSDLLSFHSEHVLPIKLPNTWFRSSCRLYGFKTRAQYSLFCSYSTQVIISYAVTSCFYRRLKYSACNRISVTLTLGHCFFPPHQIYDFWYIWMAASESYQLYVWTTTR